MKSTINHHQFLATDQPQTCHHCGLRTEILADLSHTTSQIQIHRCPDHKCRFELVVSFEEEQELCLIEEPD